MFGEQNNGESEVAHIDINAHISDPHYFDVNKLKKRNESPFF